MSSAARLGGTAAVALAIACGVGLAACGEDDEPATTPAGTTGVTGEADTTTGEATSPTTTTTDAESPGDEGSGGTAPPLVPDEGHEGGGPDPGTEEAESAEENATGGVGADQQQGASDQQQGASGGQSPTDAFEQFCEQNPRACE